METPPANTDLRLQLSTTQFTTTAAAWHVLGLLLRRGAPARPSELASSSAFFYPATELTRFLCSIPNSPIRLTDDQSITFSRLGLSAIARSIASSCVNRRCLDLPQFVPRLLASVGLDSSVVRTYCRKRKRLLSEIDVFPLISKRSSFSGGCNGEKSLTQMALTITGGLQNVFTQDFGTIPNLSSFMEYDSCKLEKRMLGPAIFTKSSSGQLDHEIKNAEYEIKEMEANKDGLDHSHHKSCSSGLLHMHKLVSNEIMSSIPLLEFSPLPPIMDISEGSKIGDINIVNPTNSINICMLSKLEVDDQMAVSEEENEATIQGCDLFPEDVNAIRRKVLTRDSGRCRGGKENQSSDASSKDRCHINNPKKTLGEANNEALFLVRPRTEGHPQSHGDMLNHLMKYSSIPKSDHKDEIFIGEKAISSTMENGKCLPDNEPEHFKIDKYPKLEKQQKKGNCDQNMNTKEERETSMEKRKRTSSTSKNHTEQKPFPDFELFIVEEEEGSGGYGTVYRARRKADGVTFAIKCPHVNANRNYVHNEMKMLERLGGKNFVIKYEGSFRSGDADCLVLEHFEHDRPEILKREVNIIDLQRYGYCLFKALAGLHKQGIVHRDVKPGNFLFSRKARKGYLIDFNLALDLRKKYGTFDNSKAGHNLNTPVPIPQTKSVPPAKSKKLVNTKFVEAVNKNAGKDSKSLLPPENLKKKIDKAKVFTGTSSKNVMKSQGADGSGITSAKDATRTRTPPAERPREPLPSHGRKALLSFAQEAMQGGNHESLNAPMSKRKRVAATPGDSDNKFLYPTPMPLHANGIAICGAGLLKNKGDGKHKREGPCVGTKGFRAPEVLFRSMHQGPKADIWSAGVTLLNMMIGRIPFTGDNDQNIKEIAKLRGSEELWEVAKLHNHESLFPTELLDVKYLSPVKLWDWCAKNTRRPDLFEVIPGSLFDLVDKCLMVNPRQRISAEEALMHDFFSPLQEPIRKHRLQRQRLNKSLNSQPYAVS